MPPDPESPPFDSVDEVVDALRAHGYIADTRLATTVFLVTRLEKPLLVEGPAGVGKTELAKALAAMTGRKLLRLQCYEGQDETKALYEWDYGKQLLYTQILREKIGQVVADAPDLESAVDRIGAQESVFFSERFLASRPLLEAVRSDEPPVLPRVNTSVDAGARRAAKDAEGRHDAAYYRTRDSVQPERAPNPKPQVTADRGSRSFGAGLGRKRAL
jgi:MoxR-like ATPase